MRENPIKIILLFVTLHLAHTHWTALAMAEKTLTLKVASLMRRRANTATNTKLTLLKETKQYLVPDAKMQPIFGEEKICAFGMAKFLKTHLRPHPLPNPAKGEPPPERHKPPSTHLENIKIKGRDEFEDGIYCC